MSIDWSLAPEGATHREGLDGFWYRFDFENDTAAYCPKLGMPWNRSGDAKTYLVDGSFESMIERPSEGEIAKQRAAAIEQMILVDEKGSLSRTHFCGLLYDAGYRKQVQP